MKEYTEPGTYELRGSVAGGTKTWTPANFAGFFYDIDANIGSEELVANPIVSTRTIREGDLVYKTSIQQKEYTANFHDDISYPIIGLFGEKYVALDDNSVDKLVKLLVDNDDEYTLRTGSTLELPNGYGLTVKQIDVEGEKVWMELSKDREFVEDEVINVADDSATWTYNTVVDDTDGVDVFKVLVYGVSADSEGSLITVGGLYLIDYQNILSIESGDEFGTLQVDTASGDTINMQSTGTIILGAGEIVDIARGMSFKVSDSDTLRYYPFIEGKIEETVPNIAPEANIISISPNPATEGESVLFEGSGNDMDGKVVKYTWTSNIDGQLNNSAIFSTSYLTPGKHIIYFRVQDDDGVWADSVSTNLTIIESVSNQKPSARIVSISPNPAQEDDTVYFAGTGSDNDGHIKGYNWTSSIDGYLKNSSSMNVSTLSVGNHTIYFSVKDEEGAWSEPDTAYLRILEDSTPTDSTPEAIIVSILPNPAIEGKCIKFKGIGSDTDGEVIGYKWRSSIDGHITTLDNFSTAGLSAGTHTIYFKVQDDDGLWSDEISANLTILNSTSYQKPSATIVSISPNPATEGECVSFEGTCNDIDGEVIDYNWRSSIDGNITTLANFSTAGLSVGTHTIYFKVQDDDGLWSDEAVKTLTIKTKTSTAKASSSGGGGGSGATTGEKYENILLKEVQSIFINADSHIEYKFKEDENAITSIQFDSLKNSGKIQTVVEVLKGRSSFAKIAAPGNVYQQMNIWVGKAGFVSPENVNNLSIGFRVERSWLEDNDIEADNIKMYRYSDDSWNSLTTAVAGEDDEYVYFESQTTGFSPFAIITETDLTDNSNVVRSKSISEEDTKADIDLEKSEKATTEKSNLSSILLVLVGALVASIGAYLAYRELR
ncbi:hypothetical protein CUN85_12830 [Methanolobus halotolerans]|uniref:PKD/Chitinase domain-containing protein n=2 Tax=Methanolobus halotolerans TaxID=2052935 RepID=A0A4E0PWE3_9EURY|nr:hypothetical protein CUN85_12830 [Methanolobus halotolerans]